MKINNETCELVAMANNMFYITFHSNVSHYLFNREALDTTQYLSSFASISVEIYETTMQVLLKLLMCFCVVNQHQIDLNL